MEYLGRGMKKVIIKLNLIFCILVFLFAKNLMSKSIYDFQITNIDGGEINLKKFSGSPILLVNTASKCGFTGQYQNLANLFLEYRDKGLVVIATPSNSFRQELSDSEKVKQFCLVNYQTKFLITDIVSVRGSNAHSIYNWLNEEHKKTPKWNFYKFLFNKNGEFVESWSSMIKPDSKKITDLINKLI